MRLHDGCPIVEDLFKKKPEYRDGWTNGLFGQVAQGLSGTMIEAVKGTRAGLTDERIEAIRQEEVRAWGNLRDPEGEAAYLENNPEIAKGVHDCELQIQLGKCATNPKN